MINLDADAPSAKSERKTSRPVPSKFAHIVLQTSQLSALIDWYKAVLGAHVTFENDAIAFLTYDDEHHRIAMVNIPGLSARAEGHAGTHHFAFTFDTLHDLADVYERLDVEGIVPVASINHGPTTSFYYSDPDGNAVELQVDNFDSAEEAAAFLISDEFVENPIGVDFEPAELGRRLRAGEPESEVKKRPKIGQRKFDDKDLASA